jgi:hypothetical protein
VLVLLGDHSHPMPYNSITNLEACDIVSYGCGDALDVLLEDCGVVEREPATGLDCAIDGVDR